MSFLDIIFCIGLLIGILHAAHILWHHRQLPGVVSTWTIVYRALWAVLLWTVLGAYLFFFWLLGLLLKPLVSRSSRKIGAK